MLLTLNVPPVGSNVVCCCIMSSIGRTTSENVRLILTGGANKTLNIYSYCSDDIEPPIFVYSEVFDAPPLAIDEHGSYFLVALMDGGLV